MLFYPRSDVLIGSARRVKEEMEGVRMTFEALKESQKNIMVAEKNIMFPG